MAYLVYHSFRDLSLEALTKKCNDYFGTSIPCFRIERCLHSLKTKRFSYFLEEAYTYEWSMAYPHMSEPPYRNLSTKQWSAEQRAYLVVHCRRGWVDRKITNAYNSHFLPMDWRDIRQELGNLARSHRISEELLKLAPSFPRWYTPDPVPGEKEWDLMQSQVKRQAAIRRISAEKVEFNRMVAELDDEDIEDELFGGSVVRM